MECGHTKCGWRLLCNKILIDRPSVCFYTIFLLSIEMTGNLEEGSKTCAVGRAASISDKYVGFKEVRRSEFEAVEHLDSGCYLSVMIARCRTVA
jgi:hypothetical protein